MIRIIARHITCCRRLLASLVAIVTASGCAFQVRQEVDQIRQAYPGLVGPIAFSGPIEENPPADDGACGPNGILTMLIPDCTLRGVCFTAACVAHDDCYSTCGASQQDCDEVFFWNMTYLCDTSTPDGPLRDRCYALAYIYYQAVQRFGGDYFPRTQEIVCILPPGDTPSGRIVGTPVPDVSPFVDADGDLMPDDWEVEVGLDPTDPADAWRDEDGDGRPNLAEYTHDTDPFNP